MAEHNINTNDNSAADSVGSDIVAQGNFNQNSKKRPKTVNQENGRRRIRRPDYKFSPLNQEQHDLSEMTLKNDLVFADGSAGTGKTHVAIARAVYAYEHKEVDRIVLCRPAVQGEENLGHLPGTAEEKIAPYMIPLYDELDKIIGTKQRQQMMAKGEIIIAPLATMRGRTLADSFVVIDEAQNATAGQMKMLLTRIGERSKCVVCGDPDQSDLPRGKTSGLVDAIKRFKNKPGVGYKKLVKVVRSRIAQMAVDVYGEDAPIAPAHRSKASAPKQLNR